LFEEPYSRDHFEYICKENIKTDHKGMGCESVEKSDLTWESVINYLESVKGRVIFDELSDYPLLKKGYAPRN